MGHITNITVTDFQRLKGTVSYSFEGITLLCGPNSAGKSAIVDAIALLRRTANEFPLLGLFDSLRGHSFDMSVKMEPRLGDSWSSENRNLTVWKERASEDFEFTDFFRRILNSKLTLSISPWRVGISVDNTPWIELSHINELNLKDGTSVWADCDCQNAYYDTSIKCWSDLVDAGLIDSEVEDEFTNCPNFDQTVLKIPAADISNILGDHKYPVLHQDEQRVMIGPIDFSPFFGPPIDWFYHDWRLRTLALIFEGVFLAFDSAEWPSLVPDDRRMLSSRDSFYSGNFYSRGPDSEIADLFNKYIDKHAPKNWTTDSSTGATFPNHAFMKLMTAFTGHQLVIEKIESNSTYSFNDKPTELEFYLRPSISDQYRCWISVASTDHENGEELELRGFEDIGSGMSYFLPVLLGLDVSSLGLFQQPELHLHPVAQCEAGDVFISAYNKYGSVALVETHSEHMILRMLRRVRETTEGADIPDELKLKPEDLVVMYFEPVGSLTEVHRIRVDKYGDFLDPWPRGFFSERENELFPGGLG